MRILLTGGAGYIGTHTLVALAAAGHDVHVVDNFCNSMPAALARVRDLAPRPFSVDRADVRDADAMHSILAEQHPDAVIHLAGLKSVSDSMAQPAEYYDVNLSGTLTLLKAMQDLSCRNLIFSSTATIYGEPVYLPYDEDHPEKPMSVYGRSKLFAEYILRDWQIADPQNKVISLRYFNPVGAHASGQIGEHPNGTPNNLMPFIAQVAMGERPLLQVFGDDYPTPDGTAIRDYLHVCDLAQAHVAALDHIIGSNGFAAINIGAGRGHSVLEMIEAFERASGRKIPYEVTSRRSGDIAKMVASSDLAQELLSWKAERGLDEMCRSLWKWQRQYPSGYK